MITNLDSDLNGVANTAVKYRQEFVDRYGSLEERIQQVEKKASHNYVRLILIIILLLCIIGWMIYFGATYTKWEVVKDVLHFHNGTPINPAVHPEELPIWSQSTSVTIPTKS